MELEKADAWSNYGVLLAHGKKDTEAEQAFRRAIAIDPNYAEAHNNLRAIYQHHGGLDELRESSVKPSQISRTIPWRAFTSAPRRGD